MDKQHLVCRIAGRALIAASLLSVAYATASAQGTVGPPPVISPDAATLAGTVSVTELSTSQANREALQAQQNAQPLEMPKHLLPDGSLTSAPRTETLEALPLTPEPNAGVESRISLAFKTIAGFNGIFAGNNATVNNIQLEPPDQGLAVHDNVVVEINNLLVQVFKSDGTPLTSPIAASAFFLAQGSSLTDTQAFFDPTSKRWFLDVVISNSSFQGFGFAVSQTSDPLGTYFIYHIRAFSSNVPGCSPVDCFPDYPKAGYDANAFFITADLFGARGFVETAVYVLPKSTLEAGPSFTPFTYIRFDRADFVVQPSVPAPGEPFATTDGGTEYLMTARNIFDGSQNVRVIAIFNTSQIVPSPLSLRQTSVDVLAETIGPTVPSTQPNVIGPFCTSRGVTSAPLLDGGYQAFQATIQKAGGNLYGVLAFGAKDGNGLNRDVLAWFMLRPNPRLSG